MLKTLQSLHNFWQPGHSTDTTQALWPVSLHCIEHAGQSSIPLPYLNFIENSLTSCSQMLPLSWHSRLLS